MTSGWTLNFTSRTTTSTNGPIQIIDIDDNGSRVELDLEFELSNRMLKIALESFFSQICDRLVNSFVQRANEVYR